MQRKTILVYSNCQKANAKGDFTFGGNIAVDLIREARLQSEDIDVILVSTRDGISRFESLYGKPDASSSVTIAGETVGLCALEDMPCFGRHVVAYIDANYCKPASTEIIKKVINPDTKLLFIGNANQDDWLTGSYRNFLEDLTNQKQPHLLNLFNSSNVYYATAGMNGKRIGIPTIARLDSLNPLTESERQQLPKANYGFMYLSNQSDTRRLVAQYMDLTGKALYVLVGKFSAMDRLLISLSTTTMQATSVTNPKIPQITYHESLPNHVMRNMTAKASGNLVISTGVNSALEAMQDGKLTYYEYSTENENFITSFLGAIRNLTTQRDHFTVSRKVIDLATLLFAQKPLSNIHALRAKALLDDDGTCQTMIASNREIIATANGKLANNIFSFIYANSQPHLQQQASAVCMALRTNSDTCIPDAGKALRRAAATGQLFELKVLIKFILATPKSGITINDTCTTRQRSALHWAAINKDKDAIQLLLEAKANLELKDSDNKIPFDYACDSHDVNLITLLMPNMDMIQRNVLSHFILDNTIAQQIQPEMKHDIEHTKISMHSTRPNK